MFSIKLPILICICVLQICSTTTVNEENSLPNERIVGGSDAQPGDAPYQVSLRENGKHKCGGSILNDRWILTAAHCVKGDNFDNETAVVGALNITGDGVAYNYSKVIRHLYYNTPLFANNIALIKVRELIEFSELVKPIEFNPHEISGNVSLFLTGWGRLSADGQLSNTLQKLNYTSLTYYECTKNHGIHYAGYGHLCALPEVGRGACDGDIGGPLVYNGTIVGVANFVIACARRHPDVFAKISYYHDWIRTTIRAN